MALRRPSVLLTILSHHDLPRLERAVRSAQQQRPAELDVDVMVIVNTLHVQHAYQAVEACEGWGVRYALTQSNGLPGRGKNACLDAFLYSDRDYLCQLDGDDWLYPTWALSVADHIRRAAALDLLALLPIDCVGDTAGYTWRLPDGASGSVWTTSTVYPWQGRGPGPADVWTQHPICPARPDLLSRKAAQRLRFNEQLAVNEDYLLLLECLAAHIAGDLQAWISMASDWRVVDRLTPSSVQAVYPQDVELLRELAAGVISRHRSSVAELPILYPPLLLTGEEKRHWIDEHHISGHGSGNEPACGAVAAAGAN